MSAAASGEGLVAELSVQTDGPGMFGWPHACSSTERSYAIGTPGRTISSVPYESASTSTIPVAVPLMPRPVGPNGIATDGAGGGPTTPLGTRMSPSIVGLPPLVGPWKSTEYDGCACADRLDSPTTMQAARAASRK